MTILFVEPDEYYQANFTNRFGGFGDLHFAATAASALVKIREVAPDVLVMELLLPDGPGYGLLRQIRSARQSSRLPVIIYSRVAHQEDITEALDFGVTAYLVKGKNHLGELQQLLVNMN